MTLDLELPTIRPSPGPTGRWYLHRAGILNVWQYDRAELSFAGGRILVRGKNGAGKSKALEMLLPFLLDGDTRRLDATGRDRTTVRWLMTTDREPGNHLGYVWLELRLLPGDSDTSVEGDGSGGADPAEYLTVGAGLRASTTTGRSDHWFFITDRRVGLDLRLDINGECLSPDGLRAAVGEDAVTESGAEHRRRVARRLFGVADQGRYQNLVHLLHRLRDPNIGNRVEEGELAAVLRDAMPPLDDQTVRDAAGRFDDLERIRQQVDHVERMSGALDQFLITYRAYTRAVLTGRVAAVLEAELLRARAARETSRLAAEASAAAGAATEASERLESLRRERRDADAVRRALEQSDAYRAHLDLTDRRATLEAMHRLVAEAEEVRREDEETWNSAEAETRAARLGAEGSYSDVVAATEGTARCLPGTGLDGRIVGSAPGAGAVATLDLAEIAGATDRAASVERAVTSRQLAARRVRNLAAAATASSENACRGDERAGRSETELTEALERAGTAEREASAAVMAWIDSVREWMAARIVTGVEWVETRALITSPVADTDWPDEVRASASTALIPRLTEARSLAADAGLSARDATDALETGRAELARLEAETEARPPAPPQRRALRDPSGGAAFYELVDIEPTLPAEHRAGLEAALEASGLLDAWVGADGVVVHPRTEDVIVHAGSSLSGGPALSEALVAVPPPRSRVGAAAINAVLASIGLGEQPAASTWVGIDGRWAVGALKGAWSKGEVEYLGAGAREATRQRRLASARTVVASCQEAAADAEERARQAGALRHELEQHAAAVPLSRQIDLACARVAAAEGGMASARARFDTDRRAAEKAWSEAARARAEVERAGAADGLPVTVEELSSTLEALREADFSIREWKRALGAFGDSIRSLERRVAEQRRFRLRLDTATERTRLHTERHRQAVADLAALEKTLGDDVATMLERHASVGSRISQLDESEIPHATNTVAEANDTAGELRSRHRLARESEDTVTRAVVDAGAGLTEALILPGVSLAAIDEEVSRPEDVLDPWALVGTDAATGGQARHDPTSYADATALARLLEPRLSEGDPATDTLLLARYDDLQHALAGGYDTAIEEEAGVKVVHVSDDTGRHPLALVAARVRSEAQAQRSRLAAQEQEVVERFLVREVTEEVRTRLLDATDLIEGTNRALASIRTSHGKGAHVDWRVGDDASDAAATAARLLVDTLRTEEQDRRLRTALLALIAAERDADPTGGYEQYLRAALDYRQWYRFTVQVTDDAKPGSRRTLSNRLGLSQGEQRVLSYLALFAAASAQFDAIAHHTPTAPRLLLLDDAFAKVDEPTHGQLLGHLVSLDLDFILTSERLWGCFPTVPSLEIYEAIRDPVVPGVALLHFHWDGHRRHIRGM